MSINYSDPQTGFNSNFNGQTVGCMIGDGYLDVGDPVINPPLTDNTQWTPNTYTILPPEDKMEKAFQLVKFLIKEKLIKVSSVPQFIDLVTTVKDRI